MEDATVSLYVHESDMARQERTIKRLFIIILLLIVLLVGTNAGWIWYESQFEDCTTVEQEIDTKDGSAFVAGIGDVTIGECKAESN